MKEKIEKLCEESQFPKRPIYRAKRVLVVGCGETGIRVTTKLSDSGNIIKIMDLNSDVFAKLPQKRIETTRIAPIVGDGTLERDLRRAAAQESDILIAATGSTTVNLMSCQIALHLFQIPKVVCLSDYDYIKDIFESLGVEVIVRNQSNVDSMFDYAMT